MVLPLRELKEGMPWLLVGATARGDKSSSTHPIVSNKHEYDCYCMKLWMSRVCNPTRIMTLINHGSFRNDILVCKNFSSLPTYQYHRPILHVL